MPRGVRESLTCSPGSGLTLGQNWGPFVLHFSSCAWPLRSGVRFPIFLPREILWSLALQVLPGCCLTPSSAWGTLPSWTQRRLIPHIQVKCCWGGNCSVASAGA